MQSNDRLTARVNNLLLEFLRAEAEVITLDDPGPLRDATTKAILNRYSKTIIKAVQREITDGKTK